MAKTIPLIVCLNYNYQTKKCKLFKTNGCWAGFVFEKDGTCEDPTKDLKRDPEENCDYFNEGK